MSDQYPRQPVLDGTGLKIGIAAARFNTELTEALFRRVQSLLETAGADLVTVRVPGSLELPFAASTLAGEATPDAIVVLGVVVAGETQHHEHIAYATSYGVQKVALEKGVPVINGILVTEDLEQAEARTRGKVDKGYHIAQAAIEMARLNKNRGNSS